VRTGWILGHFVLQGSRCSGSGVGSGTVHNRQMPPDVRDALHRANHKLAVLFYESVGPGT
jgi:hypothetical protein